jgi:hypothetical protein
MTTSGFENSDLQKKEAAAAQPDQPEDSRRSEKRLARGLEDVSYLFLSQESDKPAEKAEEQSVAPEQGSSVPAPIRTPILLRASPAINRELLISLLSGNTAVLEEGMRAIDTSIPCDPFGVIDLVAVDRTDRLCIVDIDAALNDELFLRGIAQCDWMVRNTPIVRRMYQGRVINFSAPPRLFLVAPGFSPLLKCAAQHITSPKVCCFGYRSVSIPGGVGIFFERA